MTIKHLQINENTCQHYSERNEKATKIRPNFGDTRLLVEKATKIRPFWPKGRIYDHGRIKTTHLATLDVPAEQAVPGEPEQDDEATINVNVSKQQY